jgi:hypothetical protein
MASVPRTRRRESAGTGVSGAGRISLRGSGLAALGQAGTEFGEAVGELPGSLTADQRAREAEQTARTENEWITSTTASAVSRWSLQIKDAQAAAPEGAPEFTPTFMGEFDEWRTATLENAPTKRAAADADSRFGILRAQLFDNSIKFEAAAGRAQRLSSFSTAMDNYASSAAIDSSQTPGLMAAAEGDLMAAEKTWMLPETVTKFRASIKPGLAGAALQGDIARNPQGVVDQINASKPGDGSLAGFLTSDQRKKLLSSGRAAVNQRNTTTAIQKNALRLEMSDIEAIHSAGLDVGIERMNAVENQVTAIGDPAMAGRLRDIQQQGVATKEFRTWQPDQLQNFINDKRGALVGKEATQGDAMLITTAEDMLTEMNTQLRNDPLIWASRSGQTVEPVAFHGEGAIESMQGRSKMAAGFAGDYDIPVRYLTNEDERNLTSILSKSSAQEKVLVMANIVQGFGNEATKVFARVSQDNRLMAHAGGLTVEGPLQAKSAVEIVNGNEAIKDGIKNLPPQSDVNQWTGEYLNGAMSMVPPTMASVIEATKAIYTDRAIKSPPEDGDAQRDLWEKSMDAALGGIEIDSTIFGSVGSWNDFGIVLPNNVNDAQFSTMINAVTDEDLLLASVGGAAPVINDAAKSPLTADKFRKARFSSIGEGQYLVDLTGVGVDFALGSGPSGKYVFDLVSIQKRLAARAKNEGFVKNIKTGVPDAGALKGGIR